MSGLVPVIDLFAGPGGLSEGFSTVGRLERKPYYKIALSIEKDIYAYETLLLRSFFRQFPYGEAPKEYYALLRGEISLSELYSIAEKKPQYCHELLKSRKQVWHAELGSGKDFDEQLDFRISEITKDCQKWILIGGPPCQAYSIIGRARNSGNNQYNAENDKRTSLYKEYLKILAKHKPSIFLMENVKGILTSKLNGESIIHKIIHDLEHPSKIIENYGKVSYRIFSLVKNEESSDYLFPTGLKPEDFIIECEHYGIPQTRHRLILLGIRDDLYNSPPDILKRQKAYTVEDVIAGLPSIRSGLSRENDKGIVWQRRLRHATRMRWLKSVKKIAGEQVYNEIKNTLITLKIPKEERGREFIPYDPVVTDDLSWWYLDPNVGGVCNHYSKAHMIEDIYRYLYVSAFGKIHGRSPLLKEFPKYLLPKHANASSGDFSDRFRVQLWRKPSATVTCHLSKDGHYFIHPDSSQCRSLTVREAARLQTFPDNYYFYGGRRQQYSQVGNAVPPLLAFNIAEIVKDYLNKI